MKNYVTIAGKKYLVPWRDWKPSFDKPVTVRRTLLGAIDATYGPAMTKVWDMEIEAYITPPDSSWGTKSDLETAIGTMAAITFVDHFETTYTSAHITGELSHRSVSPMVDGSSNKVYYKVRIKA